MAEPVDHVARLGATIVRENGGCRVLCKRRNAVFPGIAPDELRQKLNDGMRHAVAHYTANLEAAGVQMEASQVEEVAFAVVLGTLYMYNLWRRDYEQYRHQPLVIGVRELESPRSHDECWFFCRREFGERYRQFAAAMTGMSIAAFEKYEQRRTQFFNG